MYLYLSLVERKKTEFYHNIDWSRSMVWFKWVILMAFPDNSWCPCRLKQKNPIYFYCFFYDLPHVHSFQNIRCLLVPVFCVWQIPQVLHRLQNKEKPIRTTFTLRFGSLKMIFECSIARCDVGLGRAIVQCQKNPLRKPKLSINRAILSAHFSAVKFCIGFFCWIGFFWFCIGFFCNWMLQLLLKIVAKNLNYASLHVCT